MRPSDVLQMPLYNKLGRITRILPGFHRHGAADGQERLTSANLAKRDIAQVAARAKTRLRRMQYRRGLIEGFPAGARLDLAPLCNPGN